MLERVRCNAYMVSKAIACEAGLPLQPPDLCCLLCVLVELFARRRELGLPSVERLCADPQPLRNLCN